MADGNIFKDIARWLKVTGEWVEQNLGDPALSKALREDLGLRTDQDLPASEMDTFRAFAKGIDPDKVAFDETVAELTDTAKALVAFAQLVKDPASQATGWDVAFLIGNVAAAQSLRTRAPVVYAMAKLAMFVSDDPEAMEQFDPALLMWLLRGQAPQNAGQRLLTRVSDSLSLIPTIVDAALLDAKKFDYLDYFYGWDVPPGATPSIADQASMRTLTMLVGPRKGVRGALSMTGVPTSDGIGGLMVSIGGEYQDRLTVFDGIVFDISIGGAGALNLAIPFDGGEFRAVGSPGGFAKIDVSKPGKSGKPAYTIGDADGTRIEFGTIGGGVDIGAERAAVAFRVKDAALVVTPGKADGFLKSVLRDDVRVAFDLGLRVDSEHGLTIEGGAGLRATIPVEKTVLDALTVHHVTLAAGPSTTGRDVTIEASGAFGLRLGPFQASVDRLGFTLDAAFRDGNFGFLDMEIGFKPPNGIGLLLDAKVVRGGGYIFFDAEKGEYGGALDLAIKVPAFSISIKAIGVLTTRLPDGGDGWALLLLIYGQFPPIQLGFGFTLTGIGGMIGLQHGVNVDALIEGMRTGVLDDILFPQNPVGDAPRIINRLRTLFPVTPRALILGPMVEIGWGTPNIVKIRMGVIVQVDDALGQGDAPVSFGRVVILGQLRVQFPPDVSKELTIVKLLVDFVGAIELDPFRVGFAARLRDSSIGIASLRIDIGGMMVLQAVFGDKPSFVIAAGGFHPDFKDVPPGLPAPIDRLSAAFPIGAAKLKIESYFATTPASVQAGASVSLKVKAGPVDVEAGIGFDAICYFKPAFKFDVKIYGSASVKFKGHRLAGISFEFRLEGPGRWRARGFGTFSILWWDIEVPFDESWGQDTATVEAGTSAQALLQAELVNPGNWSAQLPIGGEPLVTLARIEGHAGVLAHPLGTLTFTQRVLPFDLELQKIGMLDVIGTTRFVLTGGYVGGTSAGRPATPLREAFAVGEFRKLSDAEKLNNPGFQSFVAGARFGDTQYSAGASAPDQAMEYEVLYLEPERPRQAILHAPRMLGDMAIRQAERLARLGAAAQSKLYADRRLHGASPIKVDVGDPPVAAASSATMQPAGLALAPGAALASMLVQDMIGRAGIAGVQAVEAFELA